MLRFLAPAFSYGAQPLPAAGAVVGYSARGANAGGAILHHWQTTRPGGYCLPALFKERLNHSRSSPSSRGSALLGVQLAAALAVSMLSLFSVARSGWGYMGSVARDGRGGGVLRLRGRRWCCLVVVLAGAAARSVLCVVLVVVTVARSAAVAVVAAVPLRVLRRCLPCPYAQGLAGSTVGGSGGSWPSISSGWAVR